MDEESMLFSKLRVWSVDCQAARWERSKLEGMAGSNSNLCTNGGEATGPWKKGQKKRGLANPKHYQSNDGNPDGLRLVARGH